MSGNAWSKTVFRSGCVWVSAVGILAFSGCVMRKETIRVSPNGAVTIDVTIEGSEEELSKGDAMPSEKDGWRVTRRVEKEGDHEKRILEASRAFEPREALPRTFSDQSASDDPLYLDFPTTLQVERREDGLYYTFRRTYTPRRFAYVNFWQEMFFDEDMKKLAEKPVDQLNRDEQLQIIQAFAGFEAFKQLEFAKEAVASIRAAVPVEAELRARRALLDVYEEDNDYFGRVLELCEPLPDEERSDCFLRESEHILKDGYRAYIDALQTETELSADQMAAFERSYGQVKRCFEITEQLGGHGFEIDVHMPGVIVAHNADKVRDAEGDAPEYVTFQFDGRAIRDRVHELIVVSRVDGGGRQGRQGR